MKKIRIVSGCPNIFLGFLNEGIVKLAKKRVGLDIIVYNLRDFTSDKHRKIDDKPYGGGPGMILRVEPIYNAYKSFENELDKKSSVTIVTDPKGELWTQQLAYEYAKYDELVIICGHYEGVDERVFALIPCRKISVGKYILSGGEVAAMAIIDSIVRLIPGCLNNDESIKYETFDDEYKIDHPQYTKPKKFLNLEVPAILFSGNHKKIKEWRAKEKMIL